MLTTTYMVFSVRSKPSGADHHDMPDYGIVGPIKWRWALKVGREIGNAG